MKTRTEFAAELRDLVTTTGDIRDINPYTVGVIRAYVEPDFGLTSEEVRSQVREVLAGLDEFRAGPAAEAVA